MSEQLLHRVWDCGHYVTERLGEVPEPEPMVRVEGGPCPECRHPAPPPGSEEPGP